MVGQASCLSVQARCLHYQIDKRYLRNSHIPYQRGPCPQPKKGINEPPRPHFVQENCHLLRIGRTK